MNIQLGTYTIPLEIIRKNNKNIYFRFKDNGTLYVTCNRFVSVTEVKRLITSNESSLLKMYKNFLKQNEKNNHFYYLGDPYTIVYDDSLKKVTIIDDMIYTKDEKMLEKWYKNEALKIFGERIKAQVINFHDIPEFTWKIRKMTTRWGVNNVTKRIITLNSELLKKDVTLIDYVIVHELCHFYEANHSQRFWNQVSIRYPYYKLARKRLRVE